MTARTLRRGQGALPVTTASPTSSFSQQPCPSHLLCSISTSETHNIHMLSKYGRSVLGHERQDNSEDKNTNVDTGRYVRQRLAKTLMVCRAEDSRQPLQAKCSFRRVEFTKHELGVVALNFKMIVYDECHTQSVIMLFNVTPMLLF